MKKANNRGGDEWGNGDRSTGGGSALAVGSDDTRPSSKLFYPAPSTNV